jgi:hypothetical protein
MKFVTTLLLAAIASAQMSSTPTNSVTGPEIQSIPLDTPACNPGYTAPSGKRDGKNAAWTWIDAASGKMQLAVDKIK